MQTLHQFRHSCFAGYRAPSVRCYSVRVAAWRSGNSVGRINEVTLRRARLVLGWVTCPGSTPGGGTLFRYVTSHAGRLGLSPFENDKLSSKL